MKISHAQVSFNEYGTPISTEFDDVYFSNKQGEEESHYVFIQGNKLLERWQTHQNHTFVIGETGFGSGLNFFITANLFEQFKQKNPDHPLKFLHFVSTEKFPLKKQDAINIYKSWFRHSEYYELYLNNYPLDVSGIHRLHFKSSITLDLHYGDAAESLRAIKSVDGGNIDAWYLDGFSPAKNKQMWSQELFEAIASLSKPNSTLATFTAAGFVKRGLQEAGFNISKRAGFGRKRDMLIGQLGEQKNRSVNQAPYFYRQSADTQDFWSTQGYQAKHVTIIGSGIAGAITALKLVQKGIHVNLVWLGKAPADKASGAPIGGFYPQLNAQYNNASKIHLASFEYARHFYEILNQQYKFDHSWCGALQVGFNKKATERIEKLSTNKLWPKTLAYKVDSEQASQIANVDLPYSCLFIPLAGWISPVSLIHSCLTIANETGRLNLHNESQLTEFDATANGQSLKIYSKGLTQIIESDILVIAAGTGSQKFLHNVIPLNYTRGQIELLHTNAKLQELNTLLCHKGYFTPQNNGYHAIGSTYVKQDSDTQTRCIETSENFDLQLNSLSKSSWITNILRTKDNRARAALRCSTADHLPVVGNLPKFTQIQELENLYKALPLNKYPKGSNVKNVFCLTGLGSRGLTTAPLMAEILVSQILNQPQALPNELLDALNPNRFLVKGLIRRNLWNKTS